MYLLRVCKYHLLKCFWFPFQNHYRVLDISNTSSSLDVKKAYKKLALEWHPDKWSNKSEEERFRATRMFQRIGEAKDVLLDEEKRKLFDEKYAQSTEQNDFVSSCEDAVATATINSEGLPKDFDFSHETQEMYEDDETVRMNAAMERFYRFYVDCVLSQLQKDKSFLKLFTSFAIPGAMLIMRFQMKSVSINESTLVSWIFLLLFNPDGFKNVYSVMTEDEKRSLFSAIAILLQNDESI